MIRLYDIQILRNESYSSEAARQYLLSSSGTYDRGAIYFETKDGELLSAATLKSGFLVAANLNNLKDSQEAARVLAEITGGDAVEYSRKMASSSGHYIELVHKLDGSAAKKLEELKIPGLEIVKEKWRYYPGNKLAANLIGFVGYDGDRLVGRYGLESYYNDLLSRENSRPVYKNFFADLFSDIKKVAETGNLETDIISTVEPNVEIKLEQELKSIQDKWNSDGTGGIVIDPNTGEIIAMAYAPSFDPNNYNKETDAAIFVNPLVERVYEMGSILKPLTMAAGLDSGAVNPGTTYNDKGFIVLDGLKVSNFDGKGRGIVNMQEVLNQSLNTGAVFVESKMGKEKFAKYFKDFGLGDETGIDLPGEVHGLINNLDSPREIEYATAAFGQGIALTPIATVRALSILANGGYLISPHTVQAFKYGLGVKKNVRWEEKKAVIRPVSAEEITRMLVTVYDEALRGGTVKMDRYSIAAKTGTAQIVDKESGGYYMDRYLHSFFGYFPAYNSKFLIFLYTINPKGVNYSSETLTEPFVGMVKFLINYYNVPPDR